MVNFGLANQSAKFFTCLTSYHNFGTDAINFAKLSEFMNLGISKNKNLP